MGRNNDISRGYPAHKSKTTALILSILLGVLGVDRFYLGYSGAGILKLLTAGGLGIWSLIDIIMIAVGSLGPNDGTPYVEDERNRQPVRSITPAKSTQQSKEMESIKALESLSKLFEQGYLTQDEFNKKKADILKN